MRVLYVFLILFLFMAGSQLNAQDLSNHRWQNRLILILSDKADDPMVNQQLSIFGKEAVGLEDRKLVVYQLTPSKFRTHMPDHGNWQTGNGMYRKYKKLQSGFEVVLIGLDGGTKMRQRDLLSCEKLFGTIDVMPMRQAELRERRD